MNRKRRAEIEKEIQENEIIRARIEREMHEGSNLESELKAMIQRNTLSLVPTRRPS